MKVMVTGAGGMTGGELARQARALGWECAAFTHTELDISNVAAVAAAAARVRPDVILNAAAYTFVDAAESNRETAMRVNSDGARNVARAAASIGASVVHISTDYVFDGTSTRPYVPTDPVKPLGAYGESKEAGERAVREECGAHLIVRTSWVYSNEGRNFVRTMLRAAAEGKGSLRIVSDQHGCPTSAADLAAALLRASEHVRCGGSLPGTYHFSNSGPTTWYDFATAVFDLCGGPAPQLIPVPASEYPAAAPRPAYSVLDTTSFQSAFGVTPRPWRDALRDTLQGAK